MKTFWAISCFFLFATSFAQDSELFPGWRTRYQGYELKVIREGEGDSSGPYAYIHTAGLDSAAERLGLNCVKYESLVWRKFNGTVQDLVNFNGFTELGLEVIDQFNLLQTEALLMTYFNFHTLREPFFVGTWNIQGGTRLEGDNENTIYFRYSACRALQ